MFKQLPHFLVVGTAGFATDAGILSLLVHIFDYNPYWSRLPSFILAVTLTWYLNYHWVFKETRSKNKFLNFSRYLAVQGIGTAINLFIYMAALYSSNYLFSHPEFAILLAALVVLSFNYLCLKQWVFKKTK